MLHHPPRFERLGLGIGAGSALASAVLFGATTPIAKQLIHATSPLLTAGLLYLGSGVGLAILRLLQDRGWSRTGLARADRPWLAVATVAGGIVAPALLMWALSRNDAATVSLLLNLETVFTAALAWFVFHEATSRRVVLGFLAILLGGILLAWPAQWTAPGRAVGLLAVVGACLCWGIDNNVTRKVSAADSRLTAAIKGLVAGGTNIGLALSLGASWPDPVHLLAILLLGFLGYGVSLVLFIIALRHLGAVRAAAYFSTAPFIGTVLAVVLFGQPLAATYLYLAAALMGLGVWLHVGEHHEHEHIHESTTHTHTHRHDAHHRHEHATAWDGAEPHSHEHDHEPMRHRHAHFPDIHHEHRHPADEEQRP
jgi:drug/metabolite transporter (DMT)-like permease